jgi:hypothetical protein
MTASAHSSSSSRADTKADRSPLSAEAAAAESKGAEEEEEEEEEEEGGSTSLGMEDSDCDVR